MRIIPTYLKVIFLVLPLLAAAQIEEIALVRNSSPDFGGVSGTWGHLQFYRPYGVKAIVLEDWRDLMTLSPLSGEPYNTDRQAWMPVPVDATLWQQMHPGLTAPADTTAASTMVNYKQGDGDFKDFTLWYHNSLSKTTRFGWVSKLRSHPRVLNATIYDEQRHRLQVNSETEHYQFKMEAGYDHHLNPLYSLAQDSNEVWYYDDDPQIRSDRWDGSIAWDDIDSNQVGTRITGMVQGGLWTWTAGDRKSLSSMASVSHQFKLFGLNPAKVGLGFVSKRLGGNKSRRHFAEFILPEFSGNGYSGVVGLKSLGKASLFPVIKMQLSHGAFQLDYKTQQLVEDRIWNPILNTTVIHDLSTRVHLGFIDMMLGSWTGFEAAATSGIQGSLEFNLPWKMNIMMHAAQVNDPGDWVLSEKQLNWVLTQKLSLFKQALHGELKLWGRHLFNTQPGWLETDNLSVTNSSFPGEDALHLLNYTLSGEVSTVIISFTDQNMLQDLLWTQYGTVSWNPDYQVMGNQLPNSRFRYLTLLWTFDN